MGSPLFQTRSGAFFNGSDNPATRRDLATGATITVAPRTLSPLSDAERARQNELGRSGNWLDDLIDTGTAALTGWLGGLAVGTVGYAAGAAITAATAETAAAGATSAAAPAATLMPAAIAETPAQLASWGLTETAAGSGVFVDGATNWMPTAQALAKGAAQAAQAKALLSYLNPKTGQRIDVARGSPIPQGFVLMGDSHEKQSGAQPNGGAVPGATGSGQLSGDAIIALVIIGVIGYLVAKGK